jgi:hypothetical protein
MIMMVIIIIMDVMCLGSLLLTGVLNLVVVSYDRLTAIVTPLEARLTVRGAHIVMVATWVTGVILGLPLVFFRMYRVRFRPRNSWKNKWGLLPFHQMCGVCMQPRLWLCFVESDISLSIEHLHDCRPYAELSD